jgi:hypothetical protein
MMEMEPETVRPSVSDSEIWARAGNCVALEQAETPQCCHQMQLLVAM